MTMFANRVARKIFRPKRDGIEGGWRNLHNEELYDLYAANIIRVVESRGMRRRGM